MEPVAPHQLRAPQAPTPLTPPTPLAPLPLQIITHPARTLASGEIPDARIPRHNRLPVRSRT